jgi:hypothetical protein
MILIRKAWILHVQTAYLHYSVWRNKSAFQYLSNKTQRYTVYIWKLLYTFRLVLPLYLQHLVFVTLLLLPAAIVKELEQCSNSSTVWQIPNAVDSVVCAPDDGWRYHPKHVENFPDINKLCNVASCWIYIKIFLPCTAPLTLKERVPFKFRGLFGISFVSDSVLFWSV